MALAPNIIEELAEYLESAELNARAVPQISIAHPSIGVEDGYAIQREIAAAKRLAGSASLGRRRG